MDISTVWIVLVACMNAARAISDCSLWMHNDREGQCKCGSSLDGTVLCFTGRIGHTLYIKRGNCMTVDKKGEVLVNSCIFTIQPINKDFFFYTPIKANTTTNLTQEICGKYSRTGLSCEQCIDGYGLPAFSYSLNCVKCPGHSNVWIKYIASVYIPLTVFFFVIIIFRVSVTSGPMVGMVIISQIISTPRLIRYDLVEHRHIIMEAAATIYSVWNLDLFRLFFIKICLNPKFNSLHILLLDYAIAIYPMMLILVTYMLVELGDRIQLIRMACKPVRMCLHYIRKEWDIKNSLIHSFASVIVLAYSRILDASISLLMPAYFYNVHGKGLDVRVQYHPSLQYGSSSHMPFLVVAIIMILVFNVLPLLLLLLYPWKTFHKLLSILKLQNRYLHIFMDAFVGCYRLKPRDLRFFPTLLLLLQFVRILVSGIFGVPGFVSVPISIYMLLSIIIALFVLQPFKVNWHNWINILVFLCGFLYGLSDALHLQSHVINTPQKSKFVHQVLYSWLPIAFGIIPLVYGLVRGIVVFTPFYVKKVLYEAFSACRAEKLDSSSLPHRFHSNQEHSALLQNSAAEENSGHCYN